MTVLTLSTLVALISTVNLILQLMGKCSRLSRSCWVVHLLVSGRTILVSRG